MPRTWTFKRLQPLERENDALRMVVIQLRREVSCKEGYAAKLELVVRQRSQTIDALRGKLEAERAAKAQLEQECEHLCEMMRLAP